MADAPQVSNVSDGLQIHQAHASHTELYQQQQLPYNNTDQKLSSGALLGLHRFNIWVVVALIIIIVAAAVGGGVGGSLAVQRAK
jgi:uncharacterized membrane protein YcfT